MLRALLAWWTAQMAELLALALRRRQAAEPDGLLVTAPTLPDGSVPALEVARRRGGGMALVGRFDPALQQAALRRALRRRRGEPVFLALGTRLLAREVTLPAAAESALPNVLRYEMDRLTPFAAADVHWGWRVLGRDRTVGELRVELWMVPKSWAAAALEALRRAGVAPTALEGRLPEGGVRHMPLDAPDAARASLARLRLRLAAGLAAALAVACLALPLLRQSLALEAAEARIAALRPEVAEAEALRRRIDQARAGAGAVAAAVARAREPLVALALLTDALPDDTFLESLTLRQGRIAIEGESAAATRLIAALAGQPHIRNPGFTAPVLRLESGAEAFSIQAEYAP
jgi:general secretion pathway protein L